MAKKKTKRRSKSRGGSIDLQPPASEETNCVGGTNQLKSVDKEDLSSQRHDEETVLSAIYGDDFTLEKGAWNCPLYKLRIRPASDVTDHGGAHHHDAQTTDDIMHNPNKDTTSEQIEITLNIQLHQKYPISVPLIQITNVKGGLSNNQISELLSLLQAKAKECAELGQVMGWEMGQIGECYLVDCVDKRKKDDMKRLEDMQMKDKKIDQIGDDEHTLDESFSRDTEHAEQYDMMDSDTQKEVARQIEALDAASQLRKQRRQQNGVLPSIVDKHDEEDDDEDDTFLHLPKGYDMDMTSAAFITAHDVEGADQQQTTSRYQSDFIEIKHLGSGGGGEVVQAINRLDRRVYAIKKVVLEGATAQNEKLRREVTTISMMNHRNIVRYYQAWVELGKGEDDEDNSDKQTEDEMAAENDSQSNEDEQNKVGSSSSWDSWSSSSDSSCASQSSASDGEQHEDNVQPNTDYARSISLDNFLEHEVETDIRNPLFGNGGLLGYPPRATSSNATSLLPTHNERLQSESSYSASEWQVGSNLSSQQRKRREANGIMYIQMQFCKTTMRGLIDEQKLKMDIVWKSLRQILEALVYIHSRNVIHRDLKPANIFIDDEDSIRLGDFGLATSNRTTSNTSNETGTAESEADALYEAIDDISGLLVGGSSKTNLQRSMDSITGGVGTTFYMAPEQERSRFGRSKTSYDAKADIYSLGILLFEMFVGRPLGSTYMERADMLTALKGGSHNHLIANNLTNGDAFSQQVFNATGEVGDWEAVAEKRFPKTFRTSIPENAQKIILWCLEYSPKNRPSANQLLESNLLPRKVELEKKYLNEVLQTLSNPQSEDSYHQILSKLFERPTSSAISITYDNEVSVKSNALDAQLLLAKSLGAVKGSHWSSRLSYSNPMSSVAAVAAVQSLTRAQNVGTISGGGKEGEVLRGTPQQAATVLAMTSATAAAIEGMNGILGADPHVVEALCSKMCDIFTSHGAIRLEGPLLRPREANDSDLSINKPVELLARRGTILNLREDLCRCFARSVARGGASTSNQKRYDINKVYVESDAGLHPKSMLEASFDIIQDASIAKSEYLEAESILVLCRIMFILAPKEEKIYDFHPIVVQTPVWFIRLTHTRLSDAIMDLMFLPTSEAIRSCCLNLLSKLTACPPTELRKQRQKNKRRARDLLKTQKIELIETCLESAVINDDLPKQSAKRLRTFLSHFVVLHLDANKVLDVIYDASKKIYHADIESSTHNDDMKRLSKNCFSEVMRCIAQLRQVFSALKALGVVTAAAVLNKKEQQPNIGQGKHISSYPAYISVDLGLRQKRNNFSGSTFFQAILLPDEFFGDNEDNHTGGKGIRIAEGGRYDDLVRQFRPPGNFGSIQVNDYTAVKVPYCIGLTLYVGKMIERLYCDAAKDESSSSWQGHSFIASLRRSIGHPLIDSSIPIQCIVTSENGLDLTTCAQRASIASILWRAGISCEYLAQSGVVLSLLRHLRGSTSAAPEWISSADRVSGLCAMLNIPLVVVVQPHLLKSKAAVKLRQITTTSVSGPVYDGSEEVVPLSSLPSILIDRLNSRNDADYDSARVSEPPHQHASHGEPSHQLQHSHHGNIEIRCIYVGQDQYFDNEHRVNNSQWKSIKKIISSSQKKMMSHMNEVVDESTPIIAIDLPFRVVRDLGSSLIFQGVDSLNSNSEITTQYPQHKKLIRNLVYALDALVRKHQGGSVGSDGKKHLRLFLYSISSDQYDMVDVKVPKT